MPYQEITLLIVGNTYVGKSSLINRITKDEFDNDYFSTQGLDINSTTINHNNCLIKIKMWDISGSTKYRYMINAYFKNIDAVVIVGNYNDAKSLTDIYYSWYHQVTKNVRQSLPIYVAINKCDNKYDKDLVLKAIHPMEEIANSIYFMSVKNNIGITEFIDDILFDLNTCSVKGDILDDKTSNCCC